MGQTGQTKKSYRRYRRLAEQIHALACHDPECMYGKPVPDEIKDREDLPWPERQALARRRLTEIYTCQYAVDAENIAARAGRKLLRSKRPITEQEFRERVLPMRMSDVQRQLNRVLREAGFDELRLEWEIVPRDQP